MNKMSHLKTAVLRQLQHLDGMRIERPEDISTEQMLGIVDLDEERHPGDLDGTLLDPGHEFWADYVRDDVNTRVQTEKEVRFAIRLLKDEGKFRLVEPEDKELPGVYVDVADTVETEEALDYEIRVEEVGANLALMVVTDDGVYETILHRK